MAARVAFKPRVESVGGVYVGVGADQNYVLAAWARSVLVVLADFDQWVIDLHTLYGVAFAVADTPDDFVAFWSREQRFVSERAIRARVTAPMRARELIELYRFARARVFIRLSKLRDALHGTPSFLTDAGQYEWLSGLSRAGRIVAIRADLRREGALQTIASVLKAASLSVNLLYTSNAEQYFRYSKAFSANIFAWPAADGALLLRTRPTTYDYTYCVQSLAAFRDQLARHVVHSVNDLAPRRLLSRERPLYEVPDDPPMTHPAKRKAGKPLKTARR